MGDVIVYVRDFEISSGYCRICHEEEIESDLQLEAPCACSGTIKFAHRSCIQRWCSEKGSTVCEICLQNYEPGYTAPSKKVQQVHTRVTIRDSLQIPLNEPTTPSSPAGSSGDYAITAACTATTDRSASCCTSLALTFTLVLLVRHFYEVVIIGTSEYPFTLATVLTLRAIGIIFPMYIIVRMLTAIHNSVRRHRYRYRDSVDDLSSFGDDDGEEERQYHGV